MQHFIHNILKTRLSTASYNEALVIIASWLEGLFNQWDECLRTNSNSQFFSQLETMIEQAFEEGSILCGYQGNHDELKDWLIKLLQKYQNELTPTVDNQQSTYTTNRKALIDSLALVLHQGLTSPIDLEKSIPTEYMACLGGTTGQLNGLAALTDCPLLGAFQFELDKFTRNVVANGFVPSNNEKHIPTAVKYLLGLIDKEQATKIDDKWAWGLGNIPVSHVLNFWNRFVDSNYEQHNEILSQIANAFTKYHRYSTQEGDESEEIGGGDKVEENGRGEKAEDNGLDLTIQMDKALKSFKAAFCDAKIESNAGYLKIGNNEYPPDLLKDIIEAPRQLLDYQQLQLENDVQSLSDDDKHFYGQLLERTGFTGIGTNYLLQTALNNSYGNDAYRRIFLDITANNTPPYNYELLKQQIARQFSTNNLGEAQQRALIADIIIFYLKEGKINIPDFLNSIPLQEAQSFRRALVTKIVELPDETLVPIIEQLNQSPSPSIINGFLIPLMQCRRIEQTKLLLENINPSELTIAEIWAIIQLISHQQHSDQMLIKFVSSLTLDQLYSQIPREDSDIKYCYNINDISPQPQFAVDLVINSGSIELLETLKNQFGTTFHWRRLENTIAIKSAEYGYWTNIEWLNKFNQKKPSEVALSYRNEEDLPLIFQAALYGQQEVVSQLLESIDNPNPIIHQPNSEYGTILHAAVLSNNLKLVEKIIKVYNDNLPIVEEPRVCNTLPYLLNIQNGKGKTALHIAAKNGYEDIVKILLNYGSSTSRSDNNNNRPVTSAAKKGHYTIVKELLVHHYQRQNPQIVNTPPIILAVSEIDSKVIECLLDGGESAFDTNKELKTPLMLAIEKRHMSIANILIARAPDAIMLQDINGYSALMYAVTSNNDQIAQCLVEAQPQTIDIPNNQGQTALMIAIALHHNELASHLLEKTNNINKIDLQGNSILHYAVKAGNIEIVEELIKRKVDLKFENQDGKTPLQLAKDLNSNPHRTAPDANKKIIQLLEAAPPNLAVENAAIAFSTLTERLPTNCIAM